MLSPKIISATSKAAILITKIVAVLTVAYMILCYRNIIFAIFIIMSASFLIPYIRDLTKVLLLKSAGLFRNQTVFANNYEQCDIMRLNVDGAYYQNGKLYIETHVSGLSAREDVLVKDIFPDDYKAADFLYGFIDKQIDRIEAVLQTKLSEAGKESVKQIMFGEYCKAFSNKTSPPEINAEEFVEYLTTRIYAEEAKNIKTELVKKKYC